jgi:hypothetical protein
MQGGTEGGVERERQRERETERERDRERERQREREETCHMRKTGRCWRIKCLTDDTHSVGTQYLPDPATQCHGNPEIATPTRTSACHRLGTQCRPDPASREIQR